VKPLATYRRMPRRLPLSLGFKRYALYFDGEGDYVMGPILKPFPVTVEALVYFIPKSDNHTVAISIGGDRYTNGIHLEALKGSSFMGFRIETPEGSKVLWFPEGANEWHFYTLTVDASDMRIYFDGDFIASRTDFTTIDYANVEVFVGRQRFIGSEPYRYWLRGSVALVRIYNRVLSEREIRHNTLNYHNPVRDGLILWFHDRITADTWYDESGYGNHGTIYGAVRKNLAAWELRAEVGL